MQNPKKIILDAYDSLINLVDIHAEETLEKHSETELLNISDEYKSISNQETENETSNKSQNYFEFNLLGENTFIDPLKSNYKLDEKFRTAKVYPKTTSVHEYVNKMREEMIDELVKIQGETLKLYDKTKSVDIKSMFGEKYCSLVNVNESGPQNNYSLCFYEDYKPSKSTQTPFNMYLVVFDFYIDENLKLILRFFL